MCPVENLDSRNNCRTHLRFVFQSSLSRRRCNFSAPMSSEGVRFLFYSPGKTPHRNRMIEIFSRVSYFWCLKKSFIDLSNTPQNANLRENREFKLLAGFFAPSPPKKKGFIFRLILIRCLIPECEYPNATDFNQDWLKYAIPYKHNRPEKCSRYEAAQHPIEFYLGQCTGALFNQSSITNCNQFVFKTNEYRIMKEVSWQRRSHSPYY